MEISEQITLSGSTVSLRFAAATDRGSVRRLNEDSFLAASPFWIVADGMGGHAFGDRASQAAIAAFVDAQHAGPITPEVVVDTINAANAAVIALDSEKLSGTTMTGVALLELDGGRPHWMAFNVGDSRTYSWDGRSLEQQSVDHSAVQELIDSGQLTVVQAAVHPQRNVVTRALGADSEVEADVWLLPVHGRQTFLLCSDGLTKELDDEEIASIIVFHDQQSSQPTGTDITLADRLVRAALAAGGRDNVTVVVVESELVGTHTADAGDTHDSRVLEDTIPRA